MDVAVAHNVFATNLYSSFALANEGKNFLMSPVSIFATLSMILPGAKRDTLDQMLSAMQLKSSTESLEAIEASIGHLLTTAMKATAGGHGSQQAELLMANRAFIEAAYQVREKYLTTLKKHFGVEITSASFRSNPNAERQRINEWVATVTKGKITNLLPSGFVTSLTRLVLVNGLYFKAKWRSPFDPRLTRPGAFERSPTSTVQAPMMRRMGNWPIVNIHDVLTAVRFDFDDGQGASLAMFAVLPAKRHRLDDLTKRHSDWLAKLLATRVWTSRAEVSLPKLRLAGRANLADASMLPSLGLAGLFADSADLSGIASTPGDLRVGGFAHQAVLEWDEIGAEGAAASAASVENYSAIQEIRFDQPFVVVVAKRLTAGEGSGGAGGDRWLPIFVGRVSDPLES